MADKVTLRFEQFDDYADNNITLSGPINIDRVVDTVQDLYNTLIYTGFSGLLIDTPATALVGSFYLVVTTEEIYLTVATGTEGEMTSVFELITPTDGQYFVTADTRLIYRYNQNEWVEKEIQNITIMVKNVNKSLVESYRDRGAYFQYKISTDSWQEVLLGSHSHDNKEILDRLSAIDIGWVEVPASNYTIGTVMPIDIQYEQFFYKTDSAELYFSQFKELDIITNDPVYEWLINDNFVIGSLLPTEPSIGQYFYNTNTFKLLVMVGPNVYDKKRLTLEVIDTDMTDLTYEYELKWEDLPNEVPIPTNEDLTTGNKLYLTADNEGKPKWVNSFIAAQTFQMKQLNILEDTMSIVIPEVYFTEGLDDVLVIEDKNFLNNRTIEYNSETLELTITAINEDDVFNAGNQVSVIIIRNGASAILDELATNYITKEEAITLLSGGSVNLKDYVTKQDLFTRASKQHTHSQFSRVGHDHDWKYASFNHTHAEYTTREKVLELIEERLIFEPGILDMLAEISNYLETNTDLATLLSTLASNQDITDIQTQIDEINNTHYNITQLKSYLNNRKFESTQIDTEFIDQNSGLNKDLNQVLQELRSDLEFDMGNTDSSEILIDEDIEVKLGTENAGSYITGNTIQEGETLNQVLTKLFQKVVHPIYVAPTLVNTFNIDPLYIEIGDSFDLETTSIFNQADAGNSSVFNIKKYLPDSPEVENILISTNEATNLSTNITTIASVEKIDISISYLEGPTKTNNFGNADTTGKIIANEITESFEVNSYRAIFLGGSTSTNYNLNSSFVRSFNREVLPSYESLDVSVKIPAGSITLLVAIPDGYDIPNILYLEQGSIDISEEFENTTVMVNGANDYEAVLYDVYIYTLPRATSCDMTLKILI